MRLTQKFNQSFNKIAGGRQDQPTTLVTTGYDAVTTTYGAFDMAGPPVVLPPPPYAPAPDPAAAPTYYNFVGLDGLGTVPGPTEWFPGAGAGPEQYPAEPSATYLTSSSPNPTYVESWQAPGFPPTVEPLQPISYSAFPPATLAQQQPARYLPVPELDDALNVLQNHAVIPNANPPVVAHKSSGKRKLEEFKTEVDDCQPSSSAGNLRVERFLFKRKNQVKMPPEHVNQVAKEVGADLRRRRRGRRMLPPTPRTRRGATRTEGGRTTSGSGSGSGTSMRP